MNILIVNDWKEYSGAEIIINILLEEYKNLGHNPKLLVKPLFHEFVREVKTFKPDIIDFHNIILTDITPILYCKKYKIPFVQSLHDYWLVCRFRHYYLVNQNRICDNKILDAPICNSCLSILFKFPSPSKLYDIYKDVTLVVPSCKMKTVLSNFGYKEENIKVIYHGIPEYNANIEDQGYVLVVASKMPWKGREIAENLSKELKDIPFKIVGVQSGKIDKIDPGYISREELYDLYRKSSLVFNPTRWEEPCGLVNLEAMMFHKVVLGLKVGALPEYIQNFTFNSLEELKDKLIDLMNNKEDRTRYGEENYKNYKERFTSRRMALEYINLMEEIRC
ncbi:MAG: glycosyltransferase family 4 protein [Ignisphaera sp.]